jgi:large subunit ribosomal protein L21
MDNKEKFAIIKLAGIQHLVHEGDKFEVNRLDAKEQKELEIKEVLLTQNKDKTTVGTPYVGGASVSLKVLEHTKGDKVDTRTYKAKSRYRRHVGFRQSLTKVEVTKISL